MLLLAGVAPPLHAASASSRSFQDDEIISEFCIQTSEDAYSRKCVEYESSEVHIQDIA
jgi:hypothetical protein